MRNRNKPLNKEQIYRRMELTNKALGCLAALGGFVLRFVVFAAFVVGIIWLISRLQPWS